MATASEVFRSADGLLPVITGLLPLLGAGGVWVLLREWAFGEEQVGQRVRQIKETMTERLATEHTLLLDALNAGRPLRGTPPDSTDFVGRYSGEIRRQMTVLFRVEGIRVQSGHAHDALFHTVLAAVVVFVAGISVTACQASGFYWLVLTAAAVLLLFQIAIALWLRRLKKRLDGANEDA